MEKLVYIVWDTPGREPDALRDELLGDLAPRLLDLGPSRLGMNVHDAEADEVPTPAWGPQGEAPYTAEVSVWLETLDDRHPFEEAIGSFGDRMAGWLVTESLCTDYGDNEWAPPRNWPDGRRSPGILTVACLEQPEGMSYEDWVMHWHTKMSPISAELQPRTRYVRNAVVRSVTPDAPPYKGIVEEAWPSADHVRDPMLFFNAGGSDERLAENLQAMAEVVSGFLDFARIRNVTMSEYLLKS